jgi:thiamine transporter ThiT
MNFFPKQTELYEKIFEVSSTYFESSVASYRANSLLKIAKIIIVLPDPVQRAYLHYMVRYCMHYVCGICWGGDYRVDDFTYEQQCTLAPLLLYLKGKCR